MSGKSAWSKALELSDATPESRNRYVDLLRAISITAVVVGHWLIAAPWMQDGRLQLDHMLSVSAWTRWLTWLFQVMPIFFMVGGYSNFVSWEAAQRSGKPYSEWLAARLLRLIGPILPLLVVWTIIAIVARRFGVSGETIKIGSQAALVPLWFLAVYVLVVLFVPWTHAAWRRLGTGSFWILVACAVAVDVARFRMGWLTVSWVNYLFVWLSVHQMGYMWRSGKLGGLGRSLVWLLGGLGVLAWLVTRGGYPLSMVGVPGEAVSNTLPPSLAMLALGALQAGVLLSLEAPARRWLAGRGAWAATILVNGMIMSVYLWHLTAMIAIIAISNALGGFGLRLVPGTSAWWATRPVWFAVLLAALFGFLAVFSRFERLADRKGPAPALWRTIPGSALVCTGLALMAFAGIGADTALGVRVDVLLFAFVGAALITGLPHRR